MNTSLLKSAVVLGLLSVVGPVAIDMYLPALPEIGRALDATDSQVQLSLMAFMAAFAVCQLIYGPVSDMVGRKPPLYFGIGLFIIGSVLCAVAPSIEWLIAARVLQGIGACAPAALPAPSCVTSTPALPRRSCSASSCWYSRCRRSWRRWPVAS